MQKICVIEINKSTIQAVIRAWFFAKKYRVTIGMDNHNVYLGGFDTALRASLMYEIAAKRLHKDFYYQNK